MDFLERETEPIDYNQPSTQYMLKQLVDRIVEPEIGILGVYGMGGVGKTSLAKQVNNHFLSNSCFDTVIMVTVSATPKIHNIRTTIGKHLRLYLSNGTRNDAREKLYNALKRKKFLLILDDVWQKWTIELEDDVGVPHPRNHKGSKILIISRSQDVCIDMGAKVTIKVRPLSKVESWNLFVEKAGDHVAADGIRCFVEKIVEKCEGLPLAIVTVAHALANQHGVWEWENAETEMKKSIKDIRGMKDKVLVLLKFSFDRLEDDMFKNLFMYCGCCFSKGYSIHSLDLLNYCVGEGLVDRLGSLTATRNKCEELIESLKSACMVEENVEYEGIVRMHDMMRELALWIASTSESNGGPKFLLRTGESCKKAPQPKEWVDATVVSLINTHIEELPGLEERCQKLFTLLLKKNSILNVLPTNFFQDMDHLSLLDLSGSYKLEYLPDSLSCLVNLRVLRLYNCFNLKALPALGKLRQLQVLDLYGCYELKQQIFGSEWVGVESNLRYLNVGRTKVSIPIGAFSRLVEVEELRLWDANNIKWSVKAENEIDEERRSGCLSSNDEGLDQQPSSSFVNELIDVGELSNLTRLTSLIISFDSLIISDWFKPLAKKIGALWLTKCRVIKQDAIQALDESNCLNWLQFVECPGLTCVPTLLKGHLFIWECDELEKLLDGAEANQDSFQRLDELRLYDLPKLERICVGRAPLNCFAQLSYLAIGKCNRLKMVFTKEMPRLFNNLREMHIRNCNEMEVIIEAGEEEEDRGFVFVMEGSNNNATLLISPFPKLKKLTLSALPALADLCNNHHILHCPLIKDVVVSKCPRLNKNPLHIHNTDGLLVTEDEESEWTVSTSLTKKMSSSASDRHVGGGSFEPSTFLEVPFTPNENSVLSLFKGINLQEIKRFGSKVRNIKKSLKIKAQEGIGQGLIPSKKMLMIESPPSLAGSSSVLGKLPEESDTNLRVSTSLTKKMSSSALDRHVGGGSFESSTFLQVAFDRFASPEFDFVRLWKIDLGDVESLKRTASKIQPLYDEAEVKQFADSDVERWLNQLKQLLCDAKGIIDEYATELLRLKSESESQLHSHQIQQGIKRFGSKVRNINRSLEEKAQEGIGQGLIPQKKMLMIESPPSVAGSSSVLGKLPEDSETNLGGLSSTDFFPGESDWDSDTFGEIKINEGSKVCEIFQDLPEDLKRCVFYTSTLFPGGYEFEQDTLIQLWIAAGFIQTELEQPAERGQKYFEELHELSIFEMSPIVRKSYDPTYTVHKDVYELKQQGIPDEYTTMDEGGPAEISPTTLHSMLLLGGNGTDFDSKIFERFYKAEFLITFKLQIEYGSPIKHVPHILFVKLKFLQVLDLSSTEIKELPTSVCNLRKLRYLDVSGTPIKKLPESVSELYDLQTLKLRDCSNLVGLPKGTSKLINLQHLDLDGLYQLTSMPPRMGQLTNLQKLSIFVVGREEGFRIEELKCMKKLRGSLCIAKMENVTEDQASVAQLGDKVAIHTLEFKWSYSSQSKGGTKFNLIEPHSSIKQLKITRYGAASFPKWLSGENFVSLAILHLSYCNCTHLPALGKLHSLESLYINQMHSLKEISHEFYGSEIFHGVAFPKLQLLEIDGMPCLEEWKARQNCDMPKLRELIIVDCPNLVTLPEFMNLKSLQHLRIILCPKIQSFPGERLPESLQSLTITECPKLKEQCQKKDGDEWCKIASIPEIWIDYEQKAEISLQKEGLKPDLHDDRGKQKAMETVSALSEIQEVLELDDDR